MLRIFFSCVLLIYYWYFYAYSFKSVPKPTTNSPSNPKPYNFKFDSKQSNHFQFILNGKMVWEHTLPVKTFEFYQDKIVATDPCYGYRDGRLIPAKGQFLYEYLKINPDVFLKFKDQNNQFTLQKGDVYYFKCLNGHIEKLDMCPSGTTLIAGICQPVSACSNRKNGTLLPHPLEASKYIICLNEKEHVRNCPDMHIFHHNRCENMKDLNHYCKYFPNDSILLDAVTRLECKNGTPFLNVCKQGTKFFDKDYCEPAICDGLPDNTKIPLPKQTMKPFTFMPGYMTCRGGKIHETKTCPQKWDEMLSKGDNLTFLPMVFDGNKCSVPTFCENVFSDDPETIVPVHEFTKYVKNWSLSKLYDHGEGYICENNTRKRKCVPDDLRISKRFKLEPACEPPMPTFLPIYSDPKCYYDCNLKSVVACPDSTFFNGSTCVSLPENAFSYNNMPLFKFDSLNFESWIKAWDYSKEPVPSCRNPESTYISLYNICSHPDCENYAFVSQIPDMAILLPREQRAKCKFYENEKTLKKEPVDFNYHFWSQRIVNDNDDNDDCQPGQTLKSGNFVWDSTIFATCNLNQPFVFCPTNNPGIIPVSQYFACKPPDTNTFTFNYADWTHFETNEIKRILPINLQNTTVIRQNKASKPENLPTDGLDIPEGRKLNLLVNQPVQLELRYRVTHPPNVAFYYIDSQNPNKLGTSPNYGFLCKLKNFTKLPLNFPKYKPIKFVESFDEHLYV